MTTQQQQQTPGRKAQNELRNNFYKTINSSWLERTKIPGDQTSWSNFSVLHEQTQKQLKSLITKASDPTIQRILSAYNSRKASIAGIDDVLKQLHRSTDPWTQMGVANKLSVDVPYSVAVYADQKDSNRHTLYGGQSGLTLPNCEYYDKPEVTKQYTLFLEKIIAKTNHSIGKQYTRHHHVSG